MGFAAQDQSLIEALALSTAFKTACLCDTYVADTSGPVRHPRCGGPLGVTPAIIPPKRILSFLHVCRRRACRAVHTTLTSILPPLNAVCPDYGPEERKRIDFSSIPALSHCSIFAALLLHPEAGEKSTDGGVQLLLVRRCGRRQVRQTNVIYVILHNPVIE